MKNIILTTVTILFLVSLLLSWMTLEEDYGAFWIVVTAFCVIFGGFVKNEL